MAAGGLACAGACAAPDRQQVASGPANGDDARVSRQAEVHPGNLKWTALEAPVFQDLDDDMAKDPSVFYANGKYYMYYTGALPGFQGGGDSWQIEYATSPDGIHWEKQGIAFKADKDTWEAGRVQAPSRAIWHDGKYYLFYTGGPRQPKNLIYTGYATSTDLVHWEKAGRILQNIERANDIFIYQEGPHFYMFYTTYAEEGHEPIFMRRSTDLINWSQPEPTGAEGEGTVVWQEQGRYYLLGALGHSSSGEKYYLFSSDRLGEFQPHGVIDMEVPAFASGSFGHGDVLQKDGESWLYFQGTNSGGETFRIGLATRKAGKP
jgi:sucrose-6-phosphate hydrolase SacC (GH32 family)